MDLLNFLFIEIIQHLMAVDGADVELKLEVARGKDCYSVATFDQWAEKWMNEVVLPKGVSQGTVVKYRSAIRHMDRVFHGVRLRDIRLSDMQQLVNSLALKNPNTGAPASKATLVNLRKVGSAIFRYARQNNIEGVPNFFDILQIPVDAPVKKRKALTSEEIDLVLNVPHWAQPMAMVMLFCGLRQGECVPLRWEDVDFEKLEPGNWLRTWDWMVPSTRLLVLPHWRCSPCHLQASPTSPFIRRLVTNARLTAASGLRSCSRTCRERCTPKRRCVVFGKTICAN